MKSRAGYWLGGGLMVLGVVGAVAWLGFMIVGINSTLDGWHRVDVPAEATVQLEARKYVVYYESSTAHPGFEPPTAFRVQVFDARTGAEVPVASYAGSFTYDSFGRQGLAQGTVTPARAGAYRIVTTTENPTSDDNIALGGSAADLTGRVLKAIVGSVLVGTLLCLFGLILLIVTAVRRHRLRRDARPSVDWRGVQQP